METDSSLTPVQRRILQFFEAHPHAVETARGIATWLGVEEATLPEAITGLVDRKWLTYDQTSAVTGFALTRDERLLAKIRESLAAP